MTPKDTNVAAVEVNPIGPRRAVVVPVVDGEVDAAMRKGLRKLYGRHDDEIFSFDEFGIATIGHTAERGHAFSAEGRCRITVIYQDGSEEPYTKWFGDAVMRAQDDEEDDFDEFGFPRRDGPPPIFETVPYRPEMCRQ